jgi:hypothetical protein
LFVEGRVAGGFLQKAKANLALRAHTGAKARGLRRLFA